MTQEELLQLIARAAAEEWTKLDLHDQELTKLPPEIGQLSSLISFNLSRTGLTSIPPEIGQLYNLTSLNLNLNQLTSIPSEFGQLNNLTELIMRLALLTSVPPEVCQLTSLLLLDLSWNKLTTIPSEIVQLSCLTSLNLSFNLLIELPPEIGQLNNLTSLILNTSNLKTIPPEIGQLTNLMELALNENQLTTVPTEFAKLTNLNSLNLSENQLKTVPAEFAKLTNLTSLDLSINKITAVLPELAKLINLTSLDLGYNQLTAVPPQFAKLTNLTHLFLRNNQLESLPATLQKLDKLKRLDLRGNLRLGISQEVLKQTDNPSLILKAYFDARRPLHEAKMLLVGQGGVGKTALTRRLLHNLPPDDSQGKTPGVDIHKYAITPQPSSLNLHPSPITLNLWDFGGQGVYQATHQFFFTSRSLYLVVINARTGEQESRLRHWLTLVGSLSDNAPVIIVVNKQDEHALHLDERALKAKYPNLLQIIPTSCTTGDGISELQEAIAAALTHLPHIDDQFPVTWFELKAQLEAMDANYITYEQYADYCSAAGIKERADQHSWVNVLHQLGVILNYQDDNYRQLEGTHVLKPEWVTDGVYRILSDPEQRIAKNSGILTSSMLDLILDPDEYPRHKQNFIVGMMQKFELSFPLPNSPNQHLIPDLLPKEQPETGVFQKTQFLQFELHYTDFLPSSILSRFMVGMMAVLDRRASWRNGAVLNFDGNRALVRADLEARIIFISVGGAEVTRRSLLNSVRMQLHAIHATFPNLPLTEHVPIPSYLGKTIDYEELLWYEEEGDLTPRYAPIRGRIDVKALLDGVETAVMRQERQLQTILFNFKLEELAQLCFDLEPPVEFEDLAGQTKSAKTRELVQLMGRNGRLDELATILKSGKHFR